ncbi:glycogen synthase GlgA [Herbivorax sp. ANBcel31]|uniref:glycogen synthase GlgA n=1 Tax=Herbivorax sp. ANBcel31 TaxID=3069754 RepID=UPI0027B0B9D8|nr:glycogen synthase GlgA [Herbivorax sp. ANBcel31]MDQ2085023.1 glycogen synthase GlgA [Herbivorax sp. ANBcel31]
MSREKKKKILFVSVEVSPFAKAGGLADVAGSLPKSLVSKGYDIRIIMPRYKKIESNMEYIKDFPVEIGSRQETCIIKKGNINFKSNKKIPVYFVDNYHYFNRENIYSYSDDAERFAFFGKAVLEMLPKIDFKPDIIHCNDWHVGPVCMLLKEGYKALPFYKDMKTLFTIHNLEYKGNFSKKVLDLFGMTEELFVPEKTEFYGMFSFMKTGLVYADIINTVSKRYAKEIQTPEYGEKLEGVLKSRSKDLFGIVNGIDYEVFNAETDKRIYKNYNVNTLNYKKDNKYALQKEMELPKKDVPVIGLVSRLTSQKGLNLIIDKIDEMMENDLQFVLVGSGEDHYEKTFIKLQEKYSDKMAVYIGFDASLSQRIYAASDFFLMPSRFEPCGLGQMISLRYGTIPIARETGGLAETIVDVETNKEEGNGFLFKRFCAEDMIKKINRGIQFYKNNKERWNKLMENAMTTDFSWDKSAKEYMVLYQNLN